uniref:Uncharacterized protein n=1 Tax=viral metagenome TaxID=1070528 RepID=A0A6H2A3L5_9ZZZZ
MVTVYTTAIKVASLLRLIKQSDQTRLVFNTTTDPTLAEVENFINEAEDYIDRETHHAWRAVQVTNEHYDVGVPYWRWYRREIPVHLKHRKIRTFVSGTDKIEIWDGSSWVDLISGGYTEGRSNDFWIDYERGIIYFINKKPLYQQSGVRVSYKYGDASVPGDIQEACTKLAAMKILENEDYKIVLPEGISQYAILSKVESWKKDVDKFLANRREILTAII